MLHLDLNQNTFLGSTIRINATENEGIILNCVFLYLAGILLTQFTDLKMVYKITDKFHVWKFYIEDRNFTLHAVQNIIYTLNFILVTNYTPKAWLIPKLETSRFLPYNTTISLPELSTLWLLEKHTLTKITNSFKSLYFEDTQEILDTYKNYTPSLEEITKIFRDIHLKAPKKLPTFSKN